ncbi:hypothetical protein PBY51_021368 [Eleginops maclovinus]|uniref:Uncharacterized protein n=1 Tax=Eleginops maclovinus TaxID=56733 RepID=A0AAN7X8Y7_ELEMC|nr:hypothetical protein PBY51_021368 [Eleginops maclovinus]
MMNTPNQKNRNAFTVVNAKTCNKIGKSNISLQTVRHNDSSGGSPLMLHVAFEPIVVSLVTSVPCEGDGAACAWRDKGGRPTGVRQQQQRAENHCFYSH